MVRSAWLLAFRAVEYRQTWGRRGGGSGGFVNLYRKLGENWRIGMFGMLSATFLGLVFLTTPLGLSLRNLSYDLPFLIRPDVKVTNAVVVYMDQESHRLFGQTPGSEWHRVLHAELIKELVKQGARVIVLDVLMDDSWTNKVLSPVTWQVLINRFGYETNQVVGEMVDRVLTQVVHQVSSRCPVVFGATAERVSDRAVHTKEIAPDRVLGPVLYASMDFPQTPGSVIRQHHNFPDKTPGLGWFVANLLGRAPPNPARTRWINYYGPPKTVPATKYHKVLEQVLDPQMDRSSLSPDFFSGKVVFVGKDRLLSDQGINYKDQYPTPYASWKGEETSGVEIQATAFLNFYRHDYLRQFTPWWTEFFLFVFSGIIFGCGLTLFRPWVATRVAILSAVLVGVGAFWLVWSTHYWFSWAVMVAVQIPVAWGWSVITATKRLYREKAVLEESLATALSGGVQAGPADSSQAPTQIVSSRAGGSASPAEAARRPGEVVPPEIPDHTLLKCIGKGAYGEVWLARDIIGSYHAVKVVYRRSFSSENPFVREFRGIQKFTPISRQHPGLVQILHVGRNEPGGYFFCIMEVGDDEKRRQQIDPDTYLPRNLGRELDTRGRLPVPECVGLGLALSDALQFLHERKLIHRDIKPSNIIFVDGVPKFADIGLVTDLASRDRGVSFLGTEGFIAPEGPGTAAADVYSLGKLLYEASMGRDRQQFPELPTNLDEWPDHDQILQLNNILLKACESEPANRYSSAAQLRADLQSLQTRISAR